MAEHQSGQHRSDSLVSLIKCITSTSLSDLLDLSPDALVVVNRSGTMVQVNAPLAALFGYQMSDLVGRPLDILLPDRFQTLHVTHREYYFASPRTRAMGLGLELLGRHKSGREFPVDISLRPVRLDDELLTIGAVRDRSEHRRAEREREQLIAQLQQQAELIERAHDAILTRDMLSRVRSWNTGASRFYGWTQEEALGRVTHSLLHTRFPVSLAAVDAQLEHEGVWEGELIHTCKDGRVVIVESRQVLLRDGNGHPTAILEINRDITPRRAMEQAAQARQTGTLAHLSSLQRLLDALPSSVYLVAGPEARLLLANRAALSIWGAAWQISQPFADFLEHNGITVFTPQGRPLALEEFATLRALRKGEPVLQHQETIRRPDGSQMAVLVNAIPLGTTEQWAGLQQEGEAREGTSTLTAPEAVALVAYQDVSSLKEAEYLKDEFIALAAHELRNPLGALKGFADTLLYQTARQRGPELAPWQQESLQEIEQASTRLEKLTEDLLDVTRVQAGRLHLSCKPTDMLEVSRHMLAQARMTTQQHRFSLQTTLSSLVVSVDRTRIEQVLANLLSNAVKYSPQGGPIELAVGMESDPAVAVLSVRDWGIGIPKRFQARIFGRFVRAENARELEIAGTGLGLSLSRELVLLHGGSLWFESVEGEGSTFFLSLPLS